MTKGPAMAIFTSSAGLFVGRDSRWRYPAYRQNRYVLDTRSPTSGHEGVAVLVQHHADEQRHYRRAPWTRAPRQRYPLPW